MKESTWRNRSEEIASKEAKPPGALVDYENQNNRHARRAKAAIARKKTAPLKKRH